MTLRFHGHVVRTCRCRDLRGHWKVTADGRFVGFVADDGGCGYRTVPRPDTHLPVLHAPTAQLAVQTLVTEVLG